MKYLFNVILTLLTVVLFAVPPVSADEILYARYPALSPDNSTIAFTYMGDIWTVSSKGGDASRLTVHEAEDIRPHYSPDGKYILYSSRRYNNYDLFIIPVEGGAPTQLIVHSGDDFGSGWTPDGDSVLFYSNRNGRYDIYKTAITGGTPVLLTGYFKEHEYNGRISSDGKYLLFNTGAGLSRWWRRDLQSSGDCDIYLQDRTIEPFTSKRITSKMGHEIWPIMNELSNEVYFVACRGDWAQLWKKSISGGEAVKLTDFSGDGVQWLNANPDGTILVFEQGFKVWTYNPADQKLSPIPINIHSDERYNLTEIKTFKGNVSNYNLSPDEKKIAAVIHGEVFVIPAKDPKDGMPVTNSSARESYPVWGSDSKTLYYASDRNGNYDIYKVDVMTGVETRLTSHPDNEVKPVISPDGKRLAFYRGLKQIILFNTKSQEEKVWVKGVFFDLGVESTIEYDWSPDSKWLTYTMGGPTYETNIHAINLDGTAYNLSRLSGYNYRPRFSPDGKLVYFSRYNEGRTHTYQIDLALQPEEFYESAFDSLFIDKPTDKSDDENDSEDKDEEAAIEVVIDIENIETRRSRAYSLTASDDYPAITADGETFVFIAKILENPEIWTITAEDGELKQITHSESNKSLVRLSKDSKTIFYLEGGKVKSIGIDGSKKETLAFSGEITINKKKLHRQKFVETWQMLNTYFYDGEFHGADWNGVREKYEPVVEHIRTEPEFRNFIKEILGELRASHHNIYSRQKNPSHSILTGELGIVLDDKTLDSQGQFRIKHIIAESPAAIAGISKGQFITHINSEKLSPKENFNSNLAGTRDSRLILTISNKPNKDGQKFTLKPISSGALSTLKYREWVSKRRAIVDSLSDSRLAYLHIRSMSGRYLEQFKEELVAIAEAKEGVIIDVRDNGGGNIAVHLLGILVKTPYFLRNFRDFEVTSENKMRSKSIEKPMALLINGYSASNSEIFAEGFRKLKLGKIIGEPTAGSVIGTSSYTLIDGTRIRRPSWGAFTVEMEDTDKKRRYPDILVEQTPDDFINGRDKQLKAAVEELLKELK